MLVHVPLCMSMCPEESSVQENLIHAKTALCGNEAHAPCCASKAAASAIATEDIKSDCSSLSKRAHAPIGSCCPRPNSIDDSMSPART